MVDISLKPTKANHIYIIYKYKKDFELNNQLYLICHKSDKTN